MTLNQKKIDQIYVLETCPPTGDIYWLYLRPECFMGFVRTLTFVFLAWPILILGYIYPGGFDSHKDAA